MVSSGSQYYFMLLSIQNISKSFALNACAWSHLIYLGIPWNFMYSFKYVSDVSVSQLLNVFACGYREYLSLVAYMYVSLLLFVIGPAKSIWTSSFGSDSVGRSIYLFLGIIGLRSSPVLVHCLNFRASATMSLWIVGTRLFGQCKSFLFVLGVSCELCQLFFS